MKRTIFMVISCVLLLGLVLAGCGGGNGGATDGDQVGVWPAGSNPTLAYYNNLASRAATGLNWTDLEYTGNAAFLVPEEWVTIWEGW